MRKGLFWIVLLCASHPLFSQGSLRILQSEEIARAIRLREAHYEKQGQEIITGYRIQLYSGKSKRQALKMEKRFETQHPGISAEIVYETPEWKALAGYYPSRQEAALKGEKFKGGFPRLVVRQDVFIRIRLYGK